jgi:hypothetical protein
VVVVVVVKIIMRCGLESKCELQFETFLFLVSRPVHIMCVSDKILEQRVTEC